MEQLHIPNMLIALFLLLIKQIIEADAKIVNFQLASNYGIDIIYRPLQKTYHQI